MSGKTWNSSNIVIQCAPVGRYDLILEAIESCILEMHSVLYNPNKNWPSLSVVKPSKLFYKIRVKKNQMVVKWDRR